MKIAIYTRKSIETDRGNSIENQIQICKEYFIRKNENCTFEVFQDEGFTGGNTDRPSFQRMMELIKAKKFNVVAVYKLDRISRNIIDFFKIYEILEASNVEFVSVTEGFDPSTPMGKIMMSMLAGFADMERMNIKQRVKDNMKLLGQKGKWSGGIPPTGYTAVRVMEDGKKASYLKLLDEEKEIIEDIYSLYVNGMSTRKIATEINLKYNLKTSQRRIGNVLYNPLYCKSSDLVNMWLTNNNYEVHGEANGLGYLRYSRTHVDNRGMKVLNNDSKTIVAVSKHEGIIDGSTWIKAQELLKEKTLDPKPRISQFSFLAHMVKCDNCKKNMLVFPGHKRKDGTVLRIFRKSCDCKTKQVSVEKVEEDVYTFLEVLCNRGVLERHLHTTNDVENYDKEISKLNKAISEKDKIINGLTEKLAVVNTDVMDVFLKKIEATIEEKKQILDKLLQLERKKILNNNEKFNTDIIHNKIKSFVVNFKNMSVEEKQMHIKTIITAVYWHSDTGEIKVKLTE